MSRFTTLGGTALAALFLFASAGLAAAAPLKTSEKTAMKAAMVAPVAMAAPTAKAASAAAPAPRGSAGVGEPKPAGEELAMGLGSSAAPKPRGDLDADGWDRRDRRRRRGSDHRLTSIIVPTAFFLCILLLVGTIQLISFRKDRNRHQTLQLMVEKGARIPVELISPRKRRGSDLRKGLVLVSTGIGVALFLLITKDARQSGAWGLGLIPAMIGAGYLLAWKLETHKNGNGDGPDQTYVDGGGYGQPTPPSLDDPSTNG